ncbi:Crp/Fnr family transcriptional regulator [Polaribacter sp. Hel1_85]|uniref:Crp/Fnr family transcriptional regulator n=1 Tax=Polaribacter sp. Hel1_85 TaxID=1250005 RepID=UPI00052DF815|nr:Crp/Fnr family transcriptional regulator [Polaribacter sp. Hel1_85]KGL64126.1 cAMP-binding protein [Polaribacter sp. Hel1_85]
MDYFKIFIENYSTSQSEEIFKAIKNIVKAKSYKKNDVIIDLGETTSKFYILKEGMVRSYVIDNKGKEYIKRLYKSISGFAPLTSLIKKKPSNYVFDCLTDCEVLEGNFYDFKALVNSNLELSLIYIKALEKVHTISENRIYDLSVLNATERYIKLKKQIPDIEDLIPQYHIASYLNITPIQLSRIRKKSFSK